MPATTGLHLNARLVNRVMAADGFTPGRLSLQRKVAKELQEVDYSKIPLNTLTDIWNLVWADMQEEKKNASGPC